MRIESQSRRDDPEIISYEDEDSPAFFFTMPNAWDDHSFNVRFTPAEAPFMVVGLQVLLYDLDGNAGEPGMEVIIAESDWGGFPGDRLEVFEVPNDDLILNSPDELDWTEILLENYEVDNILIEEEEDFHIVLNVVHEDRRDTLAIISDDGGEQETDRSGFWMGDDERWVRMEDVDGIDIGLNLFIRAIVDYDVEEDGFIIEPIPLDFGEVSVSTTAEMALTITNLNVDDLLISNVEVEGDCFAAEFEEEITIEHEESFELPVAFTPNAVGEFQGILILFTNDPDEGEVQVDLIGVGINDAPVIITPIENVEVNEDSGITGIAQLDTVFFDPNGDVLIYEVDGPDELNLEITEDNILTVRPDDNYTAPDLEVTVTADDGQGEMISSRYGLPGRDLTTDLQFMITVRSINDLPTRFNLLEPEDNSETTDYPSVTFVWSESIDEVEGDDVSYALVLNWNEQDYWFRVIPDTFYAVHRDDLAIDSTTSTEIEWKVFAYDGIDSVLSGQTYHLTVAPLAVGGYENTLPSTLAISPVFPNPFNLAASIKFAVPTSSHVRLSVFNAEGQLIATLLEGHCETGYYNVTWNAVGYPAGVYILLLESQNVKAVTKGILIK
jgi:hypothetical protein